MINNEGHINQLEKKLRMETKPHGHGDIHVLIHEHKLGE